MYSGGHRNWLSPTAGPVRNESRVPARHAYSHPLPGQPILPPCGQPPPRALTPRACRSSSSHPTNSPAPSVQKEELGLFPSQPDTPPASTHTGSCKVLRQCYCMLPFFLSTDQHLRHGTAHHEIRRIFTKVGIGIRPRRFRCQQQSEGRRILQLTTWCDCRRSHPRRALDRRPGEDLVTLQEEEEAGFG